MKKSKKILDMDIHVDVYMEKDLADYEVYARAKCKMDDEEKGFVRLSESVNAFDDNFEDRLRYELETVWYLLFRTIWQNLEEADVMPSRMNHVWDVGILPIE